MQFNRQKRYLFTLAVFFCFFGCTNYTRETQEIRANFQARDFSSALAKFEESNIKPEGKDRLLYFLEKAMILDRLDKLKESRSLLLKADATADELYTESISNKALSMVYNDTAQDYPGEDYEKVAIHAILALSFIEEGQLESAAVQARKINNKLHELNQAYDEGKNKYSKDAFALYLSGLIYDVQSNFDSAIIDYRKALDAFEEGYEGFNIGGVPDQLVIRLAELYRKRSRNSQLTLLQKSYEKLLNKNSDLWEKDNDSGEIVVIHEVGNISTKVPEDFIFPLGGELIRLSFPKIQPNRHTSSGKSGIQLVEDKKFKSAENFQDLNRVAYQTLEDRRGRLILKQAARLILKSQMRQEAKKQGGPLADLAMQAYNVATEVADTRSWTLLPSAFYVSRLKVKPGSHKIKITTNGRLAEITEISVKPQQIVILRNKAG
ncbi:MAG: hypothetical protein KBD78_06165 [Oligoflexales bacterium]|nr:hypothetical protein [Oligoflexales bacterium]